MIFHSLPIFGAWLRYVSEVAEAPSAQWEEMLFLPNIAVKTLGKHTRFSRKEIKQLKSIAGKYLMLSLRQQENNRNIQLLYQVTAVSACAPPENKHLPPLPWNDLSNVWPFYSQGCRRHRARQGIRTMSAASRLLTSLLCLPQRWLERGMPSRWACLAPFDHSFWVSPTLGKCSSC